MSHPARHEGTEPPGVSHPVNSVAGEDRERVGALDTRHEGPYPVGPVSGGGDQQLEDHLGVRGGLQADPGLQEAAAQLRRVNQVAVVGHGQRAVDGLDHLGLDVAQRGPAGGAVAVVADCGGALEGGEVVLVEYRAHQARAPMQVRCPPVAADDACGFLATVLQRVQAEERNPGRVAAGCVHPDHSAFLPDLVEGKTGHVRSRSRAARTRSSARSGVESTHVRWPILRPGRASRLP